MADNKNENQQSQAMLGSYDANGNYVDPYGVTFYDGFTGKNLNNADTEKSAYGDDSTLATYNTGNNKGGTNDKYTGENTRNTYTGYNADIKTADLNPDYQYGGLAQQQESIDNSYIANRNDNIASALYNEGRRSIEDVADFLNQQSGFQNSTAEQRQNTINSVWKRIGQIEAQNQQNNEQPTDPNKTPEGEKNDALNNMESDLNKSTAGELYGKVTADQDTHITTLEDENSVYRAMNESRITAFKNLQTASSDGLAAAIVSGSMATDSQQMRDLMQYDPAKYQEIQTAVKKLRGQMNINAITSGEGDFNTAATNGQSGINNEIVDFANSNSSTTSSTDILKSINQTLSSNVDATSASETMSSIENDMATLQNRLKNLKREANDIFKGDVPQYIVNAYVANRTAEIQDQLSILENRYNAAYSRYQDEVKQTQWQMEFDLKKEELQLKKDAAALDMWATQQGVALDWAKLGAATSTTSSTTVSGGTVQTTSLSREEIGTSIDSLVDACTNGKLGNAQCAAGIQKYYLPTLGVDLGSLSAYSAKKGICNWLAGEYTPQKGDLVVMSSSSKPQNGHIGIVIGVEGDTLKYMDWNGSLDSNGNGTETAKVRTTKLSNSKIYGYYDPTKGQNQGGVTYNPDLAPLYSDLLQKGLPAGTKQAATLKSMGLNPNDSDAWEKAFAQANAWKESTKDDSEVLSRMDAIEKLFNLKDKENRRGRQADTSFMGGFLSIFSAESGDFRTNYNFIKDNITFDKLLELKRNGATFGALSDNELRAIGNAAARLSTQQSTKDFYKDLLVIYNGLRKAVGEPAITMEQMSSTSAVTNNQLGYSRNQNSNQQSQTGLSAADKARSSQGF